ncbi:uncharacterized protein LOC143911269 isoform X2 [Arctopsyche grandis]|uniref:uncharacterized protein LOC143911269 isoform X2 n=1 Tax=Arctopsyche grandis TaxID=121162 RepID=UPI00406D951F
MAEMNGNQANVAQLDIANAMNAQNEKAISTNKTSEAIVDSPPVNNNAENVSTTPLASKANGNILVLSENITIDSDTPVARIKEIENPSVSNNDIVSTDQQMENLLENVKIPVSEEEPKLTTQNQSIPNDSSKNIDQQAIVLPENVEICVPGEEAKLVSQNQSISIDSSINTEQQENVLPENVEISVSKEEAKLNQSIPNNSSINSEPQANSLLENVDMPVPKDESKFISQEEWAKRESALLEKISMMEKVQDINSNKGLQLQLQVKSEENEILKAKVINLETELSAVLKKPNAKNKDIVSKIKKQHDELLTKARGMIFDKTKMIKNQELQIEALTSQVSSLKDVIRITKDLLGIRNLEVTHLQERLEIMDLKIQSEKERHALMAKKIETGTKLNETLKTEYQTQLYLFRDLKSKYEEKFKALENSGNQPSSSKE